jgi:HEAT repeat protein
MAIRIPRRWRLRTLMIVVVICAAGLAAYREYADRGPVYWQLWRLRTGDAWTRSQAAFRIGVLGPRASFAVGALIGALDDPDHDVRTQAMYALVRLGSRSSRMLPVLVAEIEQHPPMPGLCPQMSPTDMFNDPPRGWPLSEGGLSENDPVEALKLTWPDAALIVRRLRKALKDPNDYVRLAAREALFAVATWSGPSSPELAEELIAVVGDYWFNPSNQGFVDHFQFEIRRQAVNALARLDRAAQARAVERLADDLRDVGSLRSIEASLLLPRLANGADAAVAVLRDQVRDDDKIKRAIALILLESFGERAAPAAPTVLQVMTERDADRRISPAFPMGWWDVLSGRGTNDPSLPRFLSPLPVGETSASSLCVRALKAMGEPVERRAIRELIGVLQDPDRDDDRKRGAITALGEFGSEAAEPALRAAMKDPSRSVRDNASAALRAIVEDRARR